MPASVVPICGAARPAQSTPRDARSRAPNRREHSAIATRAALNFPTERPITDLSTAIRGPVSRASAIREIPVRPPPAARRPNVGRERPMTLARTPVAVLASLATLAAMLLLLTTGPHGRGAEAAGFSATAAVAPAGVQP